MVFDLAVAFAVAGVAFTSARNPLNSLVMIATYLVQGLTDRSKLDLTPYVDLNVLGTTPSDASIPVADFPIQEASTGFLLQLKLLAFSAQVQVFINV